MHIKVILKNNEVETGYGTKWNKVQDLDYFANLGNQAGFELTDSKENENTFFIEFKKI